MKKSKERTLFSQKNEPGRIGCLSRDGDGELGRREKVDFLSQIRDLGPPLGDEMRRAFLNPAGGWGKNGGGRGKPERTWLKTPKVKGLSGRLHNIRTGSLRSIVS